MTERYEPNEIELRWQDEWKERGSFRADLTSGPKYYVLEMFPYPSGRIHMGHVRNYAIGDVIARYKRARGFQVIHPMGWDAFGLPAENAAIDRGVHPWKWTYDNIAHMRRELQRMGYSYEWDRELATCHPGYYKWEQLLFIRMVEKGIAYRKTQLVNYCPHDKTVLANEQVKEGKCERCGTTIEMQELPAWYFRITDYAQELLDGSMRSRVSGSACHRSTARMDRTLRRRRGRLSSDREGRRPRDPQNFHHAAGHALRRHLHEHRCRAPARLGAGARHRTRR